MFNSYFIADNRNSTPGTVSCIFFFFTAMFNGCEGLQVEGDKVTKLMVCLHPVLRLGMTGTYLHSSFISDTYAWG
jgi:hypothetical protein